MRQRQTQHLDARFRAPVPAPAQQTRQARRPRGPGPPRREASPGNGPRAQACRPPWGGPAATPAWPAAVGSERLSGAAGEGALRVQAGEAAQRPDGEDVPVARVADGAGLVEDPGDVLLKECGDSGTRAPPAGRGLAAGGSSRHTPPATPHPAAPRSPVCPDPPGNHRPRPPALPLSHRRGPRPPVTDVLSTQATHWRCLCAPKPQLVGSRAGTGPGMKLGSGSGSGHGVPGASRRWGAVCSGDT